uniref:Uncharacterized protein n=1 Tax=Arundo donax TaxID=35708 RepID=A0A0A9GGH8_ARUDO
MILVIVPVTESIGRISLSKQLNDIMHRKMTCCTSSSKIACLICFC